MRDIYGMAADTVLLAAIGVRNEGKGLAGDVAE
jgi:hypothetical protein